MTSRDDRPKASDIFANFEPMFGEKVPFKQAYPEIQSCTIKVTRPKKGPHGDTETFIHSGGEFVDCTNTLCYGGGVQIGPAIREMIREKKTQHTIQKVCKGFEGSKGGKRKYRDCVTFFIIEISIVYKPTQSQES